MDQLTTEIANSSAHVLDSTTLLASPSSPQKVESKNKGLIGKIPVTIAQIKVQIYVEAAIGLPEPALTITNVGKSVLLNRYQLLPTDDKKSAKLLLSGVVRKMIQYAIPNKTSPQNISGEIRFSSFDVPFKCFAKVDYLAEPDIFFNDSSKALHNADFSYSCADTSEFISVNSQRLNERIYCELVESNIREVVGANSPSEFGSGDSANQLFNTLNESMVVELILRVIQNQQVEVPGSDSGGSDGKGGGSGGGGSNGKSSGSGSGGGNGKSGGSGGNENRNRNSSGEQRSKYGGEGREGADGRGDRGNRENMSELFASWQNQDTR